MSKTSSTSTALQPIAAATIAAPAAPTLPAGPLERLPDVGDGADPYWRLVTAFLVGYPPHSSRAYFSDLKAWWTWCAGAERASADRPAPPRRRLGAPPLRTAATADGPAGFSGVDRQTAVVPEPAL